MSGSNIEFLDGPWLLRALLDRLYCYFLLYSLFQYIQAPEEDRELSWDQILFVLFSFTSSCCLDYFRLVSDA